jgi:hypothetical protein
MQPALQFFLHTEVGHFLLYLTALTAIQSMDAPTAQSSGFYRWSFKFLNSMSMSFKRAFGAKVENSPNFQAAVDIQTRQAGVDPIQVTKPADPPGPAGNEPAQKP